MMAQLAQMRAVSAAETESAEARAKAGWSEEMTADEAVERYGDRLIGEYVAVKVLGFCRNDIDTIRASESCLTLCEPLHVLNVPEGGER